MNELDIKIKEHFREESVLKTPERYKLFHGRLLPSFIKDWLVSKFTMNDGELDVNRLISFMNDHIPSKSESIKRKLQTDKEEIQILCRVIVETDIKMDVLRFAIPDLGIKTAEGRIPHYVARKHPELKDNEVWGIVKLAYSPPSPPEHGYIDMINFKAFAPYKVDLNYYKDMSKVFSFEEWVDVLIRAMEYNPSYDNPNSGFDSIEKKLLFLSRLLVFVEPNLNVIELAPKGTGKSYVFGNLSKYGWMFSGGKVSRAKLFYDMAKKMPGIIEKYDFVTFDEVETISFSDEGEMLGALKNYLESGKFTMANYSGASEAGLMLLGNLPLDKWGRPIYQNYFKELNPLFQNSALLDRFNMFIEGWNLIRINEDILLKGFSLNVEYFSEMLHRLRKDVSYSYIVSELLDIPKGADTRDTKSIIKVATAYLKLLFPWVTSPQDVDKYLFQTYCLKPAIEKRAIIKQQISMIDPEFSSQVPDIRIKQW
jgi:ATP-dependent Lon protease